MAARSFPRGGAGCIVRELVSGKMEEGEWRILVANLLLRCYEGSGGSYIGDYLNFMSIFMHLWPSGFEY